MTHVVAALASEPSALVAVEHLKQVYERGIVLEDVTLRLRG